MTMLIQGDTANDVWIYTYGELNKYGIIQEGRDQSTKELLHVMFEIENPRERFVHSRRINLAFALMEVIWIMNGRNELNDLVYWNPRMANYSDYGDRLHGAYGHRLRQHYGFDQLEAAYHTLSINSSDRQVVLQIWDGTYDLQKAWSEKPLSKDIPCNLMSHLLVRDNKLHWLQVMRSNDLIWGTPYNFIQWTMLQEIMAGWLELEVGPYTHVSDSLHIYERHWNKEAVDLVEHSRTFENTDKFNYPYSVSTDQFYNLLQFSHKITKDDYIPSKGYAYVTLNNYGFPEPYKNIAAVLMTEVLHKERNLTDAIDFLINNCTNPAYVELQLAWMNRKK